MAQKWYQKASVQVALVTGFFLILGMGINILWNKSQNTSTQPSQFLVSFTPTPQPSPLPSTAPNSPPKEIPVRTSRRNPPILTPIVPVESNVSGTQSPAISSMQNAVQSRREELLDKYIALYIEKYSHVDLGDAPCEPKAIEQ